MTPKVISFRILSTNPVSENAVIELTLPMDCNVVFSVYDISGREIVSENFSNVSAGIHTMTWKREDRYGCNVSPGSYFFRLEAAGNIVTGKFVVVE